MQLLAKLKKIMYMEFRFTMGSDAHSFQKSDSSLIVILMRQIFTSPQFSLDVAKATSS